jgi:phenylalanine-4-hydroxylase
MLATPTPDADLPAAVASAQDEAAYTPTDDAVWRVLYERRLPTLRATASRLFLEGLDTIGLEASRVPSLDRLNARLTPRTGWRAVPVRGFIPAREFFASLARREFPTVTSVRPPAQLDYVEAPDIFHDVFGHVPLHAQAEFAGFLSRFGTLAARAERDDHVTALARLFWFTVEFGLIREDGEVKVYGSGLISSHADAANALSDRCTRRPFRLDEVLAQPFEIDHLQDTLFVVESFEQLDEAVRTLEARG